MNSTVYVREKKTEENVHFERGCHHPVAGDFFQSVRTRSDDMGRLSFALVAFVVRRRVRIGFYSQ